MWLRVADWLSGMEEYKIQTLDSVNKLNKNIKREHDTSWLNVAAKGIMLQWLELMTSRCADDRCWAGEQESGDCREPKLAKGEKKQRIKEGAETLFDQALCFVL